MQFDAEGGNGVITYTLTNATDEVEVTASCPANWVSDIAVGENITFVVAANEGDARESKITATWGQLSFEVAIKQAKAEQEPEPEPGKVIELNYIQGSYYTPEQMEIEAHNYFFALSSVEWDGTEEGLSANAAYFYFDIYADSVNADYSIPNGVYELDIYDSYEAGTLGSYYTYGFETDGTAEPANWYVYTDATVTVTDGKLVAELVLESGEEVSVVYEGSLALAPVKDDDEGGSEGDIVINATDYSYAVEYYENYYTDDSDNWMVFIYEDVETFSGEYIIIDLISNPANDDWSGSYSCLVDTTNYMMTYVPGYVDEEGYLAGCWYTVLDGGQLTDVYAPLYDGEISIELNDNGQATFTFDCLDDQNNSVTGTVTATPLPEASSKVANMSKATLKLNNGMKSMAIR